MMAIEGAPHSSVVWWTELERWVNPYRTLNPRALPKGWELTKVRDIARQMNAPCEVKAGQKYRMVGVKWYGEGTFERETVNGEEISAKYLFPLKPGAFIYNRLFAWKASFAVVPTEHKGCFVSSEFPQFIVDESRANAQYLRLYFTTNKVVRAVEAASVGTAAVSRNRFKEEEFLSFSIPLPPLQVQEATVAHWRKAQEEIVTTEKRVAELEAEIMRSVLKTLGLKPPPKRTELPKAFALWWKDIPRWSAEYLARLVVGLEQPDKARFPMMPMAKLTEGRSGGTPSTKQPLYWGGKLPWVSPKDMKTLEITDSLDHLTDYAVKENAAALVPENSILVVVRSGILQRVVPVAISRIPVAINQDLRAFTIKDPRLLPDFLLHYLSVRQDKLLRLVKYSTTVQSMNKEELEAFPVSVPPLDVQREIVDMVAKRRAEIARERYRAAKRAVDVAREVEEMILGIRPAGQIPHS